jgi:GxxExxY protein
MTDLLFKDEADAIVGAALEVYNQLGPGAYWKQSIKRRWKLNDRSIPFVSQKELRIRYKGRSLKKTYTPDLICYNKIIVELKALDRLTSKDMAQVLNYLKATGFRLGLLINFGNSDKLEWERRVK